MIRPRPRAVPGNGLQAGRRRRVGHGSGILAWRPSRSGRAGHRQAGEAADCVGGSCERAQARATDRSVAWIGAGPGPRARPRGSMVGHGRLLGRLPADRHRDHRACHSGSSLVSWLGSGAGSFRGRSSRSSSSSRAGSTGSRSWTSEAATGEEGTHGLGERDLRTRMGVVGRQHGRRGWFRARAVPPAPAAIEPAGRRTTEPISSRNTPRSASSAITSSCCGRRRAASTKPSLPDAAIAPIIGYWERVGSLARRGHLDMDLLWREVQVSIAFGLGATRSSDLEGLYVSWSIGDRCVLRMFDRLYVIKFILKWSFDLITFLVISFVFISFIVTYEVMICVEENVRR